MLFLCAHHRACLSFFSLLTFQMRCPLDEKKPLKLSGETTRTMTR